MIEQFVAIIEKENEPELLSFLQSLSDDQKKKLTPQIKELTKEYARFGSTGGNNYGHLSGTNAQRDMLQLTSFVCFNRTDYEKTPYSIWMLNKENSGKIIDWYCPVWFNDYVNKQATLDYVPYYIHYDWIMELAGKGLLHPAKELLVKIMPQMIFERGEKNNWHFKPENVLKLKITLQEHIWYLFELESILHYSDRFLHFDDNVSKEKTGWIVLFKQYMAENLIDRFRLLKESLLASNRNFNKILSGWFSQLFTELNPTKEETLNLQKELFSVLSSPNSKPVNTSLQAIKTIIAEKEFDAASFLDAVPVLLSSDTKATILSSLMILEKISQKHPAYCQKIILMICQCFIHPDEALQSKAARIILKYGDTTNTALRDEIAAFYPSMLMTARQSLASFYDAVIKSDSIPAIEKQTHDPEYFLTTSSTAIPFPANTDDLVFLASQAFDNNEPWHMDVLPAALVHFRPHLKEEDIQLFEPAFQRAFGLIKNGLRSTTGNLDHLLALFFIDFGNLLIRHFPTSSKTIEKIYRSQDTTEGKQQTSFLVSPAMGSYTARWEPFSKIAFYQPYKQLLLTTLEKIKQDDDLPLLSTPTHTPCWIYPGILIDRLFAYQHAGKEPDSMDLQVAISRCFLYNKDNDLEQANQKLSGEFREVMSFLLNDGAIPQKPFHHKAAWMVASLTKKEKKAWPGFESFSYYKKSLRNYTGQLRWESVKENYISTRYDYQAGKNVKATATRKILSVHTDVAQMEKISLKKIFSKLLPAAKDDPPMLYDFLHYSSQYLSSEYNDVKRILSLIPNNPEPIIADTIRKCLKNPELFDEGDKKMVVAVLHMLYDIWLQPGNMAELFLGTCMLSSDKTIINIAGEIWLKAVITGTINNAELGKIIGLHERIEFAPLKRFTDLANQTLARVSALHNRELQTLIEHLLLQLPDEPVKNVKKLLEIYGELVAINNSTVKLPGIADRLKIWGETAGLRKIVASLIT